MTLRSCLALTLFLAGLRAEPVRAGAILREVYSGISGSTVASLTNNAAYPNSPSSTNWVTDLFEAPVDIGSDYGQRMRGYILPPESGFYRFWIASDDQSELWLSTNAAPAANYQRIARVSTWTSPREWTKETNQASSLIHLEAGQMYGIYALMKEGAGGDNLAVRWQLPSGSIEAPIPATRLLPPGGPFGPPVLVSQSATNVTVDEGGAVAFSVVASNLYPLAFQWRRNGTDVPGGTSSNLVLDPVSLTNDADSFHCVVSNALGVITSAPCVLVVVSDTNAPSIAAVYNVSTTLIAIVFSEPVDSNTALAVESYGIDGGVAPLSASFGADGRTVQLLVTPLTIDAVYTLDVSNVTDRAASPNAIAAGSQWIFTARGFAPAAIGPADAPALSYTTNGFNMSAAGAGFGDASDAGGLNYILQSGDFDVRVRLEGLDLSDVWAKAGIMARATLAAESDFSAVLATPSISGAFFEYRGSGPNLLLNEGFEGGRWPGVNPTNWNGDWYTAHALTNDTIINGIRRAPAAARSGTWMMMTTNNAHTTGDNYHGTAQFFSCEPGATFLFSGYYLIQSNLVAGQSTFLKLEWYDSDTNRLFVNEAESEHLSSRQIAWTYSAVTATAPAGASLGKAVVLMADLDGTTNRPSEKFLVYWDDTSLKAGTAGQTLRSGSLPVSPPDTWLRLKREGNLFSGFAGYDGSRWTVLGSVSNALPATIYLGMAVSSRDAAEATTARFRDWGAAVGGTTGRQETADAEPPGPSSRRTGLVISEILYNPEARQDGKNLEFIELFNSAPYDIDVSGWRIGGDISYTLPSGTTARAGGFLVIARVPADLASVYGVTNALGPIVGNLPNGSGQVSLYNDLGGLLLDVEYTDHHPWPAAPDGVGPSLVLARPSYGEGRYEAWSASAKKGGSPGAMDTLARSPYASLSINEVLAHTDLPDLDFIELYNAGPAPVDISGMILRVDTNTYAIPAATSIPAGGFAVFTEAQMGFVIRMEGARVSLQDAAATHVIDMVLLGATENGIAVGRFPDGAPAPHELAVPTPGTNNAALLTRDIVINEIMFHPFSNEDADEYVELYNRGTSTVDIGSWRISDGITYTFPTNTLVAPGGFVVVGANVTNLIAKYPQLSATNTFGNYSGRLSDNSDRLALEMPEDPGLPTVNFVLVDEVVYGDGWGTWSDGDGSSLELMDAHDDNRLAANWISSDETAKGQWTTLSVTGLLDHGIGAADTLHVMTLKASEVMIDDLVVMRTTVNRVTNNTFNANDDGWTARGNHMRSSWSATGGVGGTGAYHIRASGGGDPGANRIDTVLWTGNTLNPGDTATMQVTARWMAGHPDLLVRLHGGWLELGGRLPLPQNLGTPGQTNSRAVVNSGPAISRLVHAPPLPAAGEGVVVRAHVADSDGIGSVFIDYRVDPSATTNTVAMTNEGAGVYSAALAGMPADTLIAYRVRAVDAAGAPATNIFPGVTSGEALFRVGSADIAGNLGTYHLWLTKDHLDAWTNAPKLSNEFWPATLVTRQRIIHNAGAHYRGSAFVRPTFDSPTGAVCAYRVDLPKVDRFLGVDELNLDTLEPWRDNTRQRERTIFWMGHQVGLPGSHQRYIGLYLNGTRRSDVYADVFHVEGEYVESWYPDDPDGEIYKVDDWIEFTNDLFEFDFENDLEDATLESFKTTGGAYKKARYRWTWEKKSNGVLDDNFTNFFALVDAANETNMAAREARLRGLVNMDEWLRVFALRHVVCDWDGYGYARGKNAYLYKPTASAWEMLLWDLDFGLGTPSSHAVDTSLFSEIADPVVSNQFLGTPSFLRAYLQAAKDIVEGPMDFARVDDVVAGVHDALTQNGIDAYPPDDMETWIGLRRNHLVTQLQAWEAPFAITSNGGADFSTNVNYIALAGTAPLDVRTLRVNGVAYEPRWISASNWVITVVLAPGVNALTVLGVDKDGNTVDGASDTMGVTYTGGASSAAGNLVINEILYNPTVAGSAFVEIHNRSASHAFDLYNMQVDGVGLTFTGSVVVVPGAFAVVVEDALGFASAFGGVAPAAIYGGTLDKGGERLQLLQLNGTNAPGLIDDVIYDDGLPWPALADGSGPSLQLIDGAEDNNRVGNWGVDATAIATPGSTNSIAADLPSFPLIWLNELMASNTAGIVDNATNRDPWAELYSQESSDRDLATFYLTDSYTNLAKWNFPAGAVVPSNGFRLVWLDGQTNQVSGTNYHAGFRPVTTTGSVALVVSNGTNLIIVDYMNHPAIATNLSYGDYPDGVWTNRALFVAPTPGASNSVAAAASVNIKINEFMAQNSGLYVTDPYTNADDWVELANLGTNSVDLTDFGLTDNLSQPFKWRFPTGTVINGGSFLVIWADNATAGQTVGLHAAFALSAGGESIGLYKPDGTTVDAFSFGAQVTDVTQGRWPDGAAGIVRLGIPTPAAANISTNNAVPSLSAIGNKSVDELALLSFTVSATDTDTPPQTLTFSLDPGAPTGAAIGALSGLFTWTPTEAQGPATSAITIRVTDNGYLARTVAETITVTVAEVNQAPTGGAFGPFNIYPGSRFSYRPPAADHDLPPNTLTFQKLNLSPPDATVDPVTGEFTWTPKDANSGFWYIAAVVVFDDGDPPLGMTNGTALYIYGTGQVFQVEAEPEPAGAGVIVRWSAETGETYRVYHADELYAPLWTELPGDVTATSVVGEKLDATTNVLGQRFYRVIRLLP